MIIIVKNNIMMVIKEIGIVFVGFREEVIFELGVGEWIELGFLVMREE